MRTIYEKLLYAMEMVRRKIRFLTEPNQNILCSVLQVICFIRIQIWVFKNSAPHILNVPLCGTLDMAFYLNGGG